MAKQICTYIKHSKTWEQDDKLVLVFHFGTDLERGAHQFVQTDSN